MATTASRSGSPKRAARGSNVCGDEDGVPRPAPSRRGRPRSPDADRTPPRPRPRSPRTPARAYSGALRQPDAWLDGRRLEDATLAAYLAELHDQGRAPASASTAVAAACFRVRLAGEPSRAGERTARVFVGERSRCSRGGSHRAGNWPAGPGRWCCGRSRPRTVSFNPADLLCCVLDRAGERLTGRR